MSKTVIGVFNSMNEAEKATDDLHRKGFSKDDVSIIAKEESARGGDNRNRDRGDTQSMSAGDNAHLGRGVTTGGAIGAGAGLLAGIGALAIPGIGPILAAGPIAAGLAGAATGGLAGGLVDWGIPEESGKKYESRVKEGKIVAAVKCEDDKVKDAADVLRNNGAYDVETH